MKIVFLDRASMGDTSLAPLEKLGALTVYSDTLTSEEVVERCKEADIIICNKVKITAAIMDALPKLRLICITATGMNNVELKHAEQKNIAVKNVAGYSTASVSQVTFALLLSLMHSVTYFDAYVKSGQYARSSLFTHYGRAFYELSDKNFGVIGMGAIGKRVADIAEAFGARVAYYSTSGKNLAAPYPSLPLDKLLKTSDVVSIHAPLNSNTYNLIGYPQLAMMKPTAYLVSIGRGKIVSEADLARALNENLIAGAALDVFEHEPINHDNPLLSIKNPEKLMLSPHIGWLSVEARRRLIESVARNIEDWKKATKS
ncbi:MAG: D-2-hydroxyacid dehydrogenase [Prevotellaceae bacterium]|jgi:glycerate dehydrogenase|nr:D-2-hydroxyacid dehydrogenase [Prevotellaceae bacterium]